MAEQETVERTREAVPFRVVSADGERIELTYSSPRPAASHDEAAALQSQPWFDPGQPLHNWKLHETDFYDEVEAFWGRRWGAEGIGGCARCWSRGRPRTRRGPSTRASGSTTTRPPPATPTSAACSRSSTSTSSCWPTTGCG